VVNRCWPSLPEPLEVHSDLEREALTWCRDVASTQQRLLSELENRLEGQGIAAVLLPELASPPVGLDGVDRLAGELGNDDDEL
jgi:hypothetical protein